MVVEMRMKRRRKVGGGSSSSRKIGPEKKRASTQSLDRNGCATRKGTGAYTEEMGRVVDAVTTKYN